MEGYTVAKQKKEGPNYGAQVFIRLSPDERKRWEVVASRETKLGEGLATWVRDIVRRHVERAEKREGRGA